MAWRQASFDLRATSNSGGLRHGSDLVPLQAASAALIMADSHGQQSSVCRSGFSPMLPTSVQERPQRSILRGRDLHATVVELTQQVGIELEDG